MTQEEKQLLLKDLCARLPYHDLWVQYDNKDWLAIGYGHERIELFPNIFSSIAGPCPLIDEIKPYLRSMSSMTEDEENELTSIAVLGGYNGSVFNSFVVVDWLNKNKFDYRGLVEKGLALEAPEGNKTE